MNELNKLTEQYERENPGESATLTQFSVFGAMEKFHHPKFVLWLATRPTCGKEQRKFLDEVEKNWYYDEENDFIGDADPSSESAIYADEIQSVDLSKVIKGE